MPSPWIRRGLVTLAGLATLAAATVATGLVLAEQRQQRRPDLAMAEARKLALPTDAASLERGRYLYATRGCVDCHGAQGAGRNFVDEGGLRLSGPNLTAGRGSATQGYTLADWDRLLRHGVKRDGRVVRVMPSQDYQGLTDADLGALVAHVRALPAVDGLAAEIRLPLPVRVLYGLGQIPDAHDLIDHGRAPAQPVPEAVSIEHGRYVAAMCVGCHGAQLAGGRIPGAPPSWPAAPDLRPGADGVLATRYHDAQALQAMLRSGRRADGSSIAVMPFESLRQLSDTDAAALHLYLSSLPARHGGS
ncbi:MAG: c-type cytochrome [Burkholderiaceae bacterium]|nr:c-type cytochrome [Burkholderiaceae bacterium]